MHRLLDRDRGMSTSWNTIVKHSSHVVFVSWGRCMLWEHVVVSAWTQVVGSRGHWGQQFVQNMMRVSLPLPLP